VNTTEYIASGIIESCVLGIATDAERAEFEQLCLQYPEVREARDAFERALEENAIAASTKPPLAVKSKIFSTIDLEEKRPAVSYRQEAKVVPIKPSLQRIVAVAAIVLLVLSTALNVYFFNQYKKSFTQYQALVQQQNNLVSNNELLQARMLEYEKTIDMMKDPDMMMVKMPAVASSPDPQSETMVFWDTVTKDVYLSVSKLPDPSPGEQYQLWAMVDGKAVNAGVFDMTEATGMMKMKNMPKAEAFAITLEKRGGSPEPSMDKLYVMGKV
jgi:anti-sigma-K factor RskA